TINTAAMIGPSFSMAMEKRSTVSRAPVFSSELISMRQRSQANARRILSTALDPIQCVGLRFAADEPDEQFLECLPAAAAGAQLVDASLRDQLSMGDHANM